MMRYSAIDRLIINADRVLRTINSVSARGERKSPATAIAEGNLNAAQKRTSACLMRVNHAGEIAAARDATVMMRYSAIDRLIINADRVLRTINGVSARGERKSPAAAIAEGNLNAAQKHTSACLMRVNHAGEIAAQGLYHGQALLARNKKTRRHMLTSARQEAEHLYWCERRITQLGGRTSLLTPLWYTASFAIGSLAALAGDRWSLAFVQETEVQVVIHLRSHLSRLPPADQISHAIIVQLIADETEHAAAARAQSPYKIPPVVAALMRTTAKIMTLSAYRI